MKVESTPQGTLPVHCFDRESELELISYKTMMTDMNNLIQHILELEQAIRYIAVLQGESLVSMQRNNLKNTSSTDSDRYEELLVNPTLLKLTTQRGNIDCGGLEFLIVKYGNFYQWISPFRAGHISICIDSTADPIAIINKIQPMLKQ